MAGGWRPEHREDLGPGIARIVWLDAPDGDEKLYGLEFDTRKLTNSGDHELLIAERAMNKTVNTLRLYGDSRDEQRRRTYALVTADGADVAPDATLEPGLYRLIETGRFPYKGHRFWRFIVTTCRQASGSPIVDDAYVNDVEGNRYTGKAILLRNWRRRDEHLARPPTRALVVGWRT